MNRIVWRDRSVMALMGGILLFVYARSWADPDLWGHVRFGLDFWREGAVDRPDPYSYLTSGARWFNHEWLAEIIFAAAYDRLGTAGLVALKASVAIAMSVVLFTFLRSAEVSALGAALTVTLATVLIVPGLATIRPQAFTYLCWAITLRALIAAEGGSTRALWMLPPLFGLWANLHGGVLAGIATLLVWLAGRTAFPRVGRPAFRPAALPAATAIAATLINPYGVRLWVFLRTAMVPRPEIVEWVPLSLPTPLGAAYLLVGGAVVAALMWSRRSVEPGLLAVLVCAILLPLTAVRHTPLFAIAVVLLAGPQIADFFAAQLARVRVLQAAPDPEGWRVSTIALFMIAAATLVALAVPRFQCIRMVGDFPARAVALLRAAEARGNMAVLFDWGEYALWHLGPAVKVSIDGRRETVYPDDVYAANMRFNDGVQSWDDLLRKYPTELALVSKNFPTPNLMKLSAGWTLAYEDPLAALYVRTGSDLSARLARTRVPDVPHDGNGLCFP